MHRVHFILRLVALTYSIVVMIYFPKWTVDDAYITLRYADNFARHGELNWNVGENPVEGYTGAALPVILAGAIKIGVSPIVTAKVIGIACYFAIAALLLIALRKGGLGEWIQTAVWVWYLTVPFLFTHAFSGLETLFFGAAAMASLIVLIVCVKERQLIRSEMALALLLLATSLIRPEGALLAVLEGAGLAWRRAQGRRREFIRSLLIFSSLYLVPAILYFFWRYQYYGQLLPNTFYAKEHSGWNGKSIRSFLLFAYYYLLISLLVIVGLQVINSDEKQGEDQEVHLQPNHDFPLLALAIGSLFILIVFFQYFRSVPLMNYSFRFFAPYFPVLLLLFAMMGTTLRKRKVSRSITLYLGALGLLQLTWNVFGLKREIDYATRYQHILEDEHIQIGKRLQKAVTSSEWLVVYMDAGAIPYYSQLKTVDLGALNDEKIARGHLQASEILDYVFGRRPGAFVFTSVQGDKVVYRPDWSRVPDPSLLMDDRRFADYKLAAKFRSQRVTIKPEYEFVYLRSDLLANW